MVARYIVSQDRDRVVELKEGGIEDIITNPVIYEGVLIGFNLAIKGEVLGTFDRVDRAIKEIGKIACSKTSVHVVSGFYLKGMK